MSTSLPRSEAASIRPRGRSPNGLAIQMSAFALSFILVALLVVTSSQAAFVAQNDNTTNTVTAAAIDLGDNDSNGAMFNSTGLMPGTSVEKCIDVTYTGNVDPLLVKIYATAAPTGTLGTYLDLTVDVGDDTADAFGSCTNFGAVGGSTNVYTGTLAGFAAAHPDYANGRSTTWDPTGTGQTKTFRFTVSVQDNPSAEGLTSTFGFSWETRTS
ncbi:MAG: hypothetical protein M3P95_08890 [Actinomycetota bacterium]|nr:hypothetical protein [Actinomycetota bacterium]